MKHTMTREPAAGPEAATPPETAAPVSESRRRGGFLGALGADLGWRMALVVLTAIGAALHAPTAVVTVFTVVAAVVVVERVVRHRRRGMLDAALVGIGMLIVVLGLTGLLLNYLPGGISRINWLVAVVLLGIGALTAAGLAGEEQPPSPFRPLFGRRSVPTALFSVGACAILAVALILSVRSFDATHVSPVDLSSTAVRNGLATVTISAGSEQGPFEVDVVSASGRTRLINNVTVGARSPASVVVPIPGGTRVLVQLVDPGTTTPLRELIFDTTTTTTATTTGSGR